MRSLFSRFSGSVRGPCGNSRCICDSWGINRRWDCSAARALWQRHQSGTYLYTAIFAAALTVDAREKSRRVQQWDDALAHVNQEAQSLQAAAAEKENRLRRHPKFAGVKLQEPIEEVIEDPFEHGSILARVEDDSGPIVQFVPIIPVTVSQDAIRLHSLDGSGTRPARSHAMPLPPALAEQYSARPKNPNECGLTPQSLWAGKRRREVGDSTTGTQKKFNLLELSTASLIMSLLDMARLEGDRCTKSTTDAIPRALRDWYEMEGPRRRQFNIDLGDNIKEVERSSDKWGTYNRAALGDALPFYKNASRSELRAERLQMHNDLQHAFGQYEGTHDSEGGESFNGTAFAELCFKISETLRRSTAAPDTTTFNILCAGFLGSTTIPERVRSRLVVNIDNYQNTTHIRPNEMTCAVMLNAYREKQDWKTFARYVARMRGEEGGLMLARRDINITTGSQGRLIPWVKPSGARVVVQAVTPHPMMFVEMIKGMVDFAGIKETLTMVENLRPEGWQLDWQCLETLLLACIKRQDWLNGQLVWKEIQALGREIDHIPTQIYSAFLALCHMCKQKADFQITFRQAQNSADMDSIVAQIRGILHVVKNGNVKVMVTVKTTAVEAAPEPCIATTTTPEIAVAPTMILETERRAPPKFNTSPEKIPLRASVQVASPLRAKHIPPDVTARINKLLTTDVAPQITEEERRRFCESLLERTHWFEDYQVEADAVLKHG